MLEHDEVVRRLGYHPATEVTAPAFEINRSAAILLAEVLNQGLPPGREAALAQTAVQEALMWANAAIATGTGPDWQRPAIDVSELVDDLLERLEGPLQIRAGFAEAMRTEIAAGGAQTGPIEGLTGEIPAGLGPIDPDPAVERLARGDCTSRSGVGIAVGAGGRCELVAGHEGDHRHGLAVWP